GGWLLLPLALLLPLGGGWAAALLGGSPEPAALQRPLLRALGGVDANLLAVYALGHYLRAQLDRNLRLLGGGLEALRGELRSAPPAAAGPPPHRGEASGPEAPSRWGVDAGARRPAAEASAA